MKITLVRRVMICVLALLASPAPQAQARDAAQRCGNHIVIYSQQQVLEPVLTRTGYFVADANKDFWCGAPYDLRIINPGSTMVMVRVFGSDPGSLTLSGIINRSDIPMSYVPPAPPVQGAFLYDSPWIPLDPTQSGTLTATFSATSSTVYHTVT